MVLAALEALIDISSSQVPHSAYTEGPSIAVAAQPGGMGKKRCIDCDYWAHAAVEVIEEGQSRSTRGFLRNNGQDPF